MEELRKLENTKFGYKVFKAPPNDIELANYYSNEYYQNPHGTYQTAYSDAETSQRNLRIDLLHSFVIKYINNPLSSIKFLDVGCGEGFTLAFLEKLGWDVTGLDFSHHGIEKMNPHLISKVRVGDIYYSLNVLKESSETYDVILLGNVLEHVLDPELLISTLHKILTKDGLLVITVPNDFSSLQISLQSSGYIDSPYWVAYPDHLNYFTLESLKNLIENFEFQNLDNFCDFPIEWFIANPNSNYSSNKELGPGAHFARVFLDNFINSSSKVELKQNFWRTMAELGLGRSITLISRKK